MASIDVIKVQLYKHELNDLALVDKLASLDRVQRLVFVMYGSEKQLKELVTVLQEHRQDSTVRLSWHGTEVTVQP